MRASDTDQRNERGTCSLIQTDEAAGRQRRGCPGAGAVAVHGHGRLGPVFRHVEPHLWGEHAQRQRVARRRQRRTPGVPVGAGRVCAQAERDAAQSTTLMDVFASVFGRVKTRRSCCPPPSIPLEGRARSMTATTIDFEWLSILSGWSLLNDSAALLRTPANAGLAWRDCSSATSSSLDSGSSWPPWLERWHDHRGRGAGRHVGCSVPGRCPGPGRYPLGQCPPRQRALRVRYRLCAQILAGLALAWVLTLARLST